MKEKHTNNENSKASITVNVGEMKQIKNYGDYLINEEGLIYSTKRNLFLKPSKNRGGYLWVNLSKKGKSRQFRIHRLVAEAFILNSENKPCVNHIDGIKLNNNVSNLEWCTFGENLSHAFRTGLTKHNMVGKKGKLHPRSKAVNQYDLENNFIKTWESIADAVRGLQIQSSGICAVCKGNRKTHNNFIWRYV